MRKWRNILESLFEYGLAVMFIQGGIRVFLFSDPVTLPGVFAYLVGAAAIYIYGAIFFLTGLALILGKILKKKKLHKHSLMAMYLLCIYVLILAVSINGFSLGLITTITVGLISAYLWARWTIRTEYINPKQFAKDAHKLR